MIAELRIRGLGVIADAVVPFAPGLTVVTGETGAGKTMLTRGGEHMAYIASLADEQEGVA